MKLQTQDHPWTALACVVALAVATPAAAQVTQTIEREITLLEHFFVPADPESATDGLSRDVIRFDTADETVDLSGVDEAHVRLAVADGMKIVVCPGARSVNDFTLRVTGTACSDDVTGSFAFLSPGGDAPTTPTVETYNACSDGFLRGAAVFDARDEPWEMDGIEFNIDVSSLFGGSLTFSWEGDAFEQRTPWPWDGPEPTSDPGRRAYLVNDSDAATDVCPRLPTFPDAGPADAGADPIADAGPEDAGAADAGPDGVDAGAPAADAGPRLELAGGGCSCDANSSSGASLAWLGALALLGMRRRRR